MMSTSTSVHSQTSMRHFAILRRLWYVRTWCVHMSVIANPHIFQFQSGTPREELFQKPNPKHISVPKLFFSSSNVSGGHPG